MHKTTMKSSSDADFKVYERRRNCRRELSSSSEMPIYFTFSSISSTLYLSAALVITHTWLNPTLRSPEDDFDLSSVERISFKMRGQ